MRGAATLRAAPTGRDQATEALRIVACYGIVAYHAHAPLHDLAYAGLVVFLFLSPFLDCHYNWERPRSISSLARVYLIPWAFWFVVYGALNLLLHKPLFAGDGSFQAVLYGTSPHLWFMPAMFAVMSILGVAKTRVSSTLIYWVSIVTASVLMVTAGLWQTLLTSLNPPFAQWIHAAPVVFAGIAFGLQGRMAAGRTASLSLLALSVIVVAVAGLPGISIPYAVGLVSSVLVVFWGARVWPAHWSVQTIASCTLGVYLVHMIFLGVFGRVTGKENHLTVLLAFAAALLTTCLARRSFPSSRRVLG